MPTPVGAGRWGSCLPVRRRASPARTVDISGRSARTKSGWFPGHPLQTQKVRIVTQMFNLKNAVETHHRGTEALRIKEQRNIGAGRTVHPMYLFSVVAARANGART